MKKKQKISWVCVKCGNISPKWVGQCSVCEEWNTFEEQTEELDIGTKNTRGIIKTPEYLNQALKQESKKARIGTKISELDRVLGGGFLVDSLSLLVGSPGIGKSTLSLQVALEVANQNKKVLMVSGEESVSQIAERADRLSDKNPEVQILNEFLIENILSTAQEERPDFLIIDSVQTIASGNSGSATGSMSQIRTVTEKIMQFTKKNKIPTILIGHVNKEGEMAGPQVLAHLVDTVLILEGDSKHDFRVLRTSKNRFGSAQEVGVFEMTEKGLQELKKPSEAFLDGRLENAIGSVIFPVIEGSRSFLVEIQALTSTTRFGLPKRTASGIPLARLSLILAILQNHARINFENKDVFVNVVGGFKVNEPAMDLPLALALVSAHKKQPLKNKLFACGELGLSGEVRAISFLEKRLKEGQKLGLTEVVIPSNKKTNKNIKELEIRPVRTVLEAIKNIF